MAYTTINKSTAYFNTKLYTGDGNTSNAITGVGFQPDLVWLKDRTEASNHQVHDAVRGKSGSNYYYIHTDGTPAQGVQTDSDGLNTLGTDGFTVGYTNSTAWNKSGNTYVSWNWKANGSGSANTDGSINSTVSVNTTSGFSIVKFTGTGANATVGHGLGVAPKMFIIKNLEDSSGHWRVYHASLGATKKIDLDNNGAASTVSSTFNDTAPTNSVFSIGTDSRANGNGEEMIAYCFAEKTGYSKFGKYKANDSDYSGSPFVYTGFKPKFIMLKNISGSGNWVITDDKRRTYNPTNKMLTANDATEETSEEITNLFSNGFKLDNSSGSINYSTNEYIYMAFGQSMVGTNNVAATAW